MRPRLRLARRAARQVERDRTRAGFPDRRDRLGSAHPGQVRGAGGRGRRRAGPGVRARLGCVLPVLRRGRGRRPGRRPRDPATRRKSPRPGRDRRGGEGRDRDVFHGLEGVPPLTPAENAYRVATRVTFPNLARGFRPGRRVGTGAGQASLGPGDHPDTCAQSWACARMDQTAGSFARTYPSRSSRNRVASSRFVRAYSLATSACVRR